MKKNSLVKFFAAAVFAVFALTSCQQNVADGAGKWDQKLENGFEYVLKYNPYDKTEKNSNFQFEIPLTDLGVKQVPVWGDAVEISFNIKAKEKLNNFQVRVVSVNGNVDGWWKEIGSYEFCSGKAGEFPSTGVKAGSIYSTKLDLKITDTANSTDINDYRLVISSELRDIDKTEKTLVRKNSQNEYFIGGTDADGVSQSRYYLGDDYDGFLSLKGAIGLTHNVIGSKTKHLEAIPTREGIKVVISLAADEILTYSSANLYESKSGYDVDITNNSRMVNGSEINLKDTLTGPAKKVEILYPFTKENELYTFNLRGDLIINGVDSDIRNEKVRARATSTTQYDEIKSTSLLSKQVSVTESGSNPRYGYKINTTYTEADLQSDIPFLTDTSKKKYVRITGQVLYGKTAWQNSEWLTGFETSNVPGGWAVNYDVFFTGANSDGFGTNYGSTFVDYGKRIKYKTYCASMKVRIKPEGWFEWESGEIWSTENLFQEIPPENNAMRYFGNTQLPNYSNGEYWYAVRDDSGTAVVFYDQDKFIICQYKYEDNARHNISWTKGTYEKNGSEYTMTAKEDCGFIDSTYHHVGNLESVTWTRRSTPLGLLPTPEILSNGKLRLSWNLTWDLVKQN
ncbi:MAG: hypothetical protein MJ182_01340 [Treponema sp.]|nr:hypothetical protein [Treponema sp.]